MKRLNALACFLFGACSDGPTLLVGTLPGTVPPTDGGARRDGSDDAHTTPPDAHAPEAATSLPDATSAACVVLPDLIQTGTLGVSFNSDIAGNTEPSGGCFTFGADAGQGPPVYCFQRTDNAPILRAGVTYALSWPIPGSDVSLLGWTLGRLVGSASACVDGEELGKLEVSIGGRGCIELLASSDEAVLSFVNATPVGLGASSFALCQSRCPTP